MDFSGIPMAQDHIDTPNTLSYDSFASSDKWTDHVKWQGSQTACPALNQLIKSSVNEAVQEAPRTSGWQRVSSYDQLPSLHSTGHHDTASNSSLHRSHARPSSKPNSSSRPHSRARLSEARIPSSDPTNLIPLFNKTNPMQFLDIMKGVSARLDENAGVRPRREPNAGSSSSYCRAKKRTRGVSLGSAPELQAGKATRRIVKKGRVDELRTSDWDEGKGEVNSASEDEGGLLHSEMRARSLQAHSSLPDMPSRLDLKRSISSTDVSFMDVDERDDMNVEHASLSAVSSSFNHIYPDARSFARTLSQTEMPPPPFVSEPFVHKQHQSAAAADSSLQQPNAHSISTPLAVSRHSNSMNKPQTSYSPSQQPPPTSHSIKQRKPDAIPKLHPLLYQKPATTSVSSSSIATAPQLQTQDRHVPIPVPDLKPPPPSLTTPMFSSTPSSRPPPLGMRRNHTFPQRTLSSSSIVQQESSPYLAGSQLPQRQKGFKSPLLSLSQPQQTQTHSRSQLKANADVIAAESGSTTATSRKVSPLNSPEASSPSDNHGFNTSSSNSMVLRSSSSSSFSDSSTSFRSTPPIKSSVSSCSHSNTPGFSESQNSNRGVSQHAQESVIIIPEQLDGDPDSSFGDMSFDMDALEETMKMYD